MGGRGSIGERRGTRPPGGNLGRAALLSLFLSRCALPAAPSYGELPLGFEANRGQWSGQVRFVARGAGYTVFLSRSEAVLVLRKRRKARNSRREGRYAQSENVKSKIRNPKPDPALDGEGAASPDSSVVRLSFPNANPRARVIGLAELPGKTHYLTGRNRRNWRTGIPAYAAVKYEGVFPGVDLIFYGRQRQLEFDFFAAPGADVSAIRFGVEAADSSGVRVDATGDLAVTTEGGEIRFRKPLVYQLAEGLPWSLARAKLPGPAGNGSQASPRRQSLEASYVVRGVEGRTGQSKLGTRKSETGNATLAMGRVKYEVGFDIAGYDRSRPLVIDPVLSYSTYLGGTGLDYAEGIAVDLTGRAYLVGYTNSADFPVSNAAQPGGGGGTCGNGLDIYPCPDVFVARLNAAGTALDYATYLGGSGEDFGTGIAVDAAGNAFLTGYTNSPDFPLMSPFQTSLGGGYDAFAVELNPQGSALLQATYLGGGGDDVASGIALASGGVWLAGFTSSPDFPSTPGAVRENFGGGPSDAFVSRLDPATGALVYSTFLGGSGEDYASGLSAGPAGDVSVAGYTNSADFPVASALQSNSAGGSCGSAFSSSPCYDAFVSKLGGEDGSLVYSTYLGGTGSDSAYAVAVDGEGNTLVAGSTTSADLPVSAGAWQPAGGGLSTDAFVTKLNANGDAILYSTYLGGLGADAALAVAVDGAGNALVTGYNLGGDFPLVSPLQTAAGNFDAFLAKLNATGTALLISTYLGGSGQDKGKAVAADPSGNAYIVGGTFSTDFPVTAGALQQAYGGGSFEGFVVKMEDLARPAVNPRQVSLLFPDQGVATVSAAQTVHLRNEGDADLWISGITVAGDFALAHDCPDALAPGASCGLEIAFSPAGLGPRSGSIRAEHNAPGSPFVVDLAGNGVAAPGLEISPASLSFAGQPLGAASAPQIVTLRNTGDALLAFSSISTGEPFALAGDCGQGLAVGAACSLSVTFAPLVPGTLAGAITVMDNAPGSPHSIALSGTGLGPAASIFPESLEFGAQLVETVSAPQALTLSNTGNRSLEIASVALSGDFAQSGDCGGTLAAGGSCTFQVSFAPGARGPQTGALTISHNGIESPAVVSLAGRGVAPVVSLSPDVVQFGHQPVGTTSPPETITLANSGDAPLNILGIAATGDFTQTNDCPGSVAEGGQCSISVTFAPGAAGGRSGMLAITHNPTSESFTVPLSGMATDFSISASPDAATIRAGETASFSLALNPIAGFTGQALLACSGAPRAATCAAAPGEVSLNGPDPVTVTLSVKTSAGSLLIPQGPDAPGFHDGPFVRLLWLVLLAALALAGCGSFRRRVGWSLAGVLLTGILWTACGGGGAVVTPAPRPATPAGNYTLTVTAISGGISRSTTVSLRVD